MQLSGCRERGCVLRCTELSPCCCSHRGFRSTGDADEHLRIVSRTGKAWLNGQQIFGLFCVEKMAATVSGHCVKVFSFLVN